MSKVEIKVPSIGESVTEVTLSSWLVKEGDYVKLDQPLAEFESDKATFEMPAEVAGVISFAAKEGDDIKIGGTVAYIDTDATAQEQSTVNSQQPTEKKEEIKVEAKKEEPVKEINDQKTYATGTPSPAAKKILDEKGIETSEVKGTGIDGRITKEDAEKAEKPAVITPAYRDWETDRKSTRLNSSHRSLSRMPSSA